jgi:hypothetical protein
MTSLMQSAHKTSLQWRARSAVMKGNRGSESFHQKEHPFIYYGAFAQALKRKRGCLTGSYVEGKNKRIVHSFYVHGFGHIDHALASWTVIYGKVGFNPLKIRISVMVNDRIDIKKLEP